MTVKGENILLGVTGGIAAYKSAELVRRLRDAGADVRALAEQALAADPESCARLGHNARALFERCCSREQAFAAWRQMLEELRAEDSF